MSKNIALAAKRREKASKGSARAVRREGRVPAVIYGDHKEPVIISLLEKDVVKEYHKGALFTHLCDLDLEGQKHLVLARDLQLDPVTDRPIHADFLRVTPKTRITVEVPIHFLNEEKSPGLKDNGGVLNIVYHEIEVLCAATDIPEYFEVDLAGKQIGASFHLSDIKLPAGVKPTSDEEDFTIATIAAPVVMSEEEETEAAAEGAEGEAAEGAEGDAAAAPQEKQGGKGKKEKDE